MKEPNATVDRIDRRGNITEHILRDDGRTLCGIPVEQTQPPTGNRLCGRCKMLDLSTLKMMEPTP